MLVAHDGGSRCLVCVGQLELDSVDAVDAVDEEDQDEDEGDLHPVLEFCYYRTLADEGKHLAADREGEGHDEEHEERHLCYEEQEDETVVERHFGGLFVSFRLRYS